MALKKPTPAFETEGGVATANDPKAQAAAAVDAVMGDSAGTAAPAAQPEAAKVEAVTAIAKASASSVATQDAANQAKAFKKEVEDMKGASDFSYGNYSVFKGSNGNIMCTESKEDLGRWALVRLISWGEHFEISPGEKGASSKDYVAYSTDGKTIDSVIGSELKAWVGKPVADYMKHMVEAEDFKLTKCRRFIDTAVALLGTDTSDGPIGKVVQVTLSESSIPAFARYQQDLADNARCVAMGLPGFKLPDDPFTFYFIREVVSKGDNTWTKLKIASTLPAKI